MNWQRAWIIAAGLLLITAGVFLWRNNLPAAFVIAVLGACSWFLSYRAELRNKFPDDDEDDEAGSDADEVGTPTNHDSDRVQNDHEA